MRNRPCRFRYFSAFPPRRPGVASRRVTPATCSRTAGLRGRIHSFRVDRGDQRPRRPHARPGLHRDRAAGPSIEPGQPPFRAGRNTDGPWLRRPRLASARPLSLCSPSSCSQAPRRAHTQCSRPPTLPLLSRYLLSSHSCDLFVFGFVATCYPDV